MSCCRLAYGAGLLLLVLNMRLWFQGTDTAALAVNDTAPSYEEVQFSLLYMTTQTTHGLHQPVVQMSMHCLKQLPVTIMGLTVHPHHPLELVQDQLYIEKLAAVSAFHQNDYL